MQDILELKHKVMQEKIQKQIDRINFCYIENQSEKSGAFFILTTTIQRKYEECYKRIRNSKKINKSIKYEQLEEIVFQELNKIEYIMIKNINEHREELEEVIKKRFANLSEIEDTQKRLEEIEKIKEVCSYFKDYINQEELEKCYIKSKFDAYMEKTKRAFLKEKREFNAFKEIKDEEELKKLEIYMEQEILKQARTLILQINANRGIKNEKLENLIKRVLLEIKLLNTKDKDLKKIKRQLESNLSIQIGNVIKQGNKTKILWQDELIKNYLITQVEQNVRKNREYATKIPFLNIYLTQMAKDEYASIKEIEMVLQRFKLLYDEKNIELLCNIQNMQNKEVIIKMILDKLKEKQELDRYRPFAYKIINKPVSTNLVRLSLKPSNFETGMEQHDNMLIKEVGKEKVVLDVSVDIYEKTIKNELRELNIWNKLLKISDKPEYEIAISLDDFEQLPIDMEKLEKLETIKDMQIVQEYLAHRIEELENLIEYVIPNTNRHCIKRWDCKRILEDFKYKLTSFFLFENTGHIMSSRLNKKICNLNTIKDNVIQEIEKTMHLHDIIIYEQQRLEQIDKNLSFEQQLEELEKINSMIKQVQTVNESLYNNYLVKKFEILAREILKCRNYETPSKERILKAIVYPYCSKEENILKKEFEKIIEYIIEQKKNYIPKEEDLKSGFSYVCGKMIYVDRNYCILDEIYKIREIVLEEFRRENKLEIDER